MTGVSVVFATVESPDDFDVDAFEKCLDRRSRSARRSRGGSPRVDASLRGDRLEGKVIAYDSDAPKRCARDFSDDLSKVAVGSGNDTGPGNGSVQFYDSDGSGLTRDGRSRDVPARNDELRVSHIF